MSDYLHSFYNAQSTARLQTRITRLEALLNCLTVMVEEGIIDREGELLLSNQTRYKIQIMNEVISGREKQ